MNNAVICRFMGLIMFFTVIFSFETYGQQLSFEQLKKVRKKAAEASAFLDKSVIIAAIVTNDLNTLTATQLAESLVGVGVSVSNATFTGANVAAGRFSDGLSNGIGIESGIILSSGDISFVNGPNDSDFFSVDNGQPGDSDLDALVSADTLDAAVLEFDFIPTGDVLAFQYVFASEEYNEFVGSSFNDVFGFFVDGVNIALIPSTTTPVAINNVNLLSNSAFYINNDPDDLGMPTPFDNLQYDGFTTVLTAQVTVTPDVTHHMKLAIADTSDEVYDSTVFISGSSLVSGDLASATTDNPTDIACDSAILHGTVNPNGLSTTVWFTYRTGVGLPIDTAIESVGGGTSDIAVSANIGGLMPGEDYFYKVVAQNSEGTNEGSEIHFETLLDGCETAITLAYFDAKAGKDGSVTLAWETATEVDNAGFNLYRAKLENGKYKKINDTLIPAQGDTVSGASYSYIDTPGNGTFYYKLEDIDYNGVSTMHGPEKVRVRTGDTATRSLKRQKRK